MTFAKPHEPHVYALPRRPRCRACGQWWPCQAAEGGLIVDAARLAEIRAREQGATTGPWRWANWLTTFGEVEGGDPLVDWRTLEAHSGGEVPRLHTREDAADWILSVEDPIEHSGNRAFIAHSRSDIPDLLAHVDALTAENERLNRDMTDLNRRARQVVDRKNAVAAERDVLRAAANEMAAVLAYGDANTWRMSDDQVDRAEGALARWRALAASSTGTGPDGGEEG